MSDTNTTIEISNYTEIKSKDLAKVVGIAESTVRKYAQALEKAGYQFTKDNAGTRIFKEVDQLVFLEVVNLRKDTGVSLDMAASVATTRRTNGDMPIQHVQPTEQTDSSQLIQQFDLQHIIEFQETMLTNQKEFMSQQKLQNEYMEKIVKDNEIYKSKLDLAVEYIQKIEEMQKIEPAKKKSIFQKLFSSE